MTIRLSSRGKHCVMKAMAGRPAWQSGSSLLIVQALHLARRCQIQKIEGPNGERIDKERFESEHLKRPSGHRRPF
jgi:hypothetical protein